ncbi:MAG: D-glycerate dehydrogenase [Ignavibacteriaceae bacterium]
MKKLNQNKKIFITRQIPEIAVNLLSKKNYNVQVYKKNISIPKEELVKNIKDADAVISLLSDNINPEVIDGMKKCKIIANYAVGYNNIDLEYAKRKNIIVTNTPDVLTDSTADLAITLALACARKVLEGDRLIRSGKFNGWEPKLLLGIELKRKKFGILGAGRIGSAAALRARAFGADILYFSNSRKEELELKTGAKKVSLNKLLKESDFISIHLPLNKETYHLINKDNLKFLKESCILINTARGEIVDEIELIKILKRRGIFAAGFDVYENEPNINMDLLKLDNVVLLPHIGSGTKETRDEMAVLAAKNVINVLEGRQPITPV